jgi:hypothetical protein
MDATSASSDTWTCSSNALPVGGQPSLASEANCHGHGAGMSAMRWSADLPVRLLTGGKRPQGDTGCSDLAALKRPVGHPHSHPQDAPRRRVHDGGQASRRLRQGARPETVRAHPSGSPSCKPLAGSPNGRRMAPRSTTGAIAPSRPRYTAWCNSTRPASAHQRQLLQLRHHAGLGEEEVMPSPR